MEDTCVIRGEIVPEGRQVCPVCESKYEEKPGDQRKGKAAATYRELTREVIFHEKQRQKHQPDVLR